MELGFVFQQGFYSEHHSELTGLHVVRFLKYDFGHHGHMFRFGSYPANCLAIYLSLTSADIKVSFFSTDLHRSGIFFFIV